MFQKHNFGNAVLVYLGLVFFQFIDWCRNGTYKEVKGAFPFSCDYKKKIKFPNEQPYFLRDSNQNHTYIFIWPNMLDSGLTSGFNSPGQ
jgi:hypothetical protein